MLITVFSAAILFAFLCIGAAMRKEADLREKIAFTLLSLTFLVLALSIAIKGSTLC